MLNSKIDKRLFFKRERLLYWGKKPWNNLSVVFRSHKVIIHLYKRRHWTKMNKVKRLLLHNARTGERNSYNSTGLEHDREIQSFRKYAMKCYTSGFNKCLETSWKAFWCGQKILSTISFKFIFGGIF